MHTPWVYVSCQIRPRWAWEVGTMTDNLVETAIFWWFLPCVSDIVQWFRWNYAWVFFKVAVTVRQCLNGHAPSYLLDHCTPLSAGTRRHLRSTNRNLFAVPRHRFNTYGGWAFAVAGPTVWNSLPDFIRDPSVSTDSFRRLLKTHLFARH